jgi:acetylglutamate kinase
MTIEAAAKAGVLVEAIPYVRRFAGRVVVVKYGGSALAATTPPQPPGPSGGAPGSPGREATVSAAPGAATIRPDGTAGGSERPAAAGAGGGLGHFAEDVALLRAVGVLPVVVHGGGPQIGDLMSRLGKTPSFHEGLRITDAETLDIARMVLVGKVNRDIVSALNVSGALAVGCSGEDAGFITAAERNPALGYVGDVVSVDPTLLEHLLQEGLVPVVATIGTDATGQAYNINADTVAGALAEALGAEKLVFLTDVSGVRAERDDPASVLQSVTADGLDALVASKAVAGGMVPKARACSHAVRHGVRSAHVLDGRVPHSLLLELLTDEGVGTMVVAP